MIQQQSFLKDLQRTLFKSLARFLSILAMIALGVGFFAGINASEPDMVLSADTYYQDRNLADFRVVSPLGFQAADIAQVQALAGIDQVEAGYTKDIFLISPAGNRSTVRLYSHDPGLGTDCLSQQTVVSGRLPENPGEIAVESGSNVPTDIQLGSQVSAVAPSGEDWTDSLRTDQFTVVGIMTSPGYISDERGQTNIGDGSISYYAAVDIRDFTIERYTDLLIRTTASRQLAAYSQAYTDSLIPVEQALDQLGILSLQTETTRLRAELQDNKDELQTSKAEAEQELADGEKKLLDAATEIADGEKTLNSEARKTRQLFADKRSELAAGRADLQAGEAKFKTGYASWQTGYADYEAGAKSAAQAKTQLDAAAAEIAAGRQSLAENKTQLDQAKAQLDSLDQAIAGLTQIRQGLPPDGTELTEEQYNQILASIGQIAPDLAQQLAADLPYGSPNQVAGIRAALDQRIATYQAQADAGRQQYETGLVQYEAGVAQLDASQVQYDQGLAEYAAGQAELAAARAKLDASKNQLDEARATLDASAAKLRAGEKALAEGEAKFERTIADKRAELIQAKADLAAARIEYTTKKYDALAEIADAEAQIRDAERQLVEIPDEWYVWNRDNNPGYAGYGDDARRIGAVAKVFPLFFFIVAALVCLTTMTRMVEEERLQIGTMKALGYGTITIASKYLIYALAASFLGTVVGLVTGFNLFPGVIMSAYGLMYNIPVRLMPFHHDYALISLALAVLTTVTAALAATLQELRATPAVLMQPKAPKPGKRIFLERIRPLWRRLSFSHKVTARNLFRYKKRLLMTIIGIAGCTGLLVTGFGLRDSINAIMDKQFGSIFTYDGQVILDADKIDTAEERSSLLAGQPGVAATLDVQSETVTAVADGVIRTYEANLIIPADAESFGQFYNLHDRVSQSAVALPAEGAIVSEKLAQMLRLAVGDTFSYRDTENRSYDLQVAGIAENYLEHFIYISPAYFDQVTVRTPTYNTIVFNLADGPVVDETALKEALMARDGVLTTLFSQDIADAFGDTIQSLNFVVLLLILSAGALAFVVLYNLTNINITERIREIATIKVLGFRDHEVSAYVYRENLLLTAGGILGGLLLGSLLHSFVMGTMEVDNMMFGKQISWLSYVFSIVLTFVFSILVNYSMFYRLRHIKMVESLKSVE